MVKEPHAGRVKTRLGRDIGLVAAAWWFRHQTGRLLRRLEDPRWNLVLAVSPDAEGLQSRVWPRHLVRWPQGQGSLGARMKRVFQEMPPGPVMIIGADIPAVTPDLIAEGFHKLGGADAVFGPAPDGGYWLVGLKRMRAISPHLFDGVRWSTEHALADTVASLPEARIAYLKTLADVDTGADLQRVSR